MLGGTTRTLQSMSTKLEEILAQEDGRAFGGIGLALLRKSERLGDSALSEPERHFYAIFGLDMDVNNGGFYSYFTNTTGKGAADALSGLPQIGASHVQSILQRACAVFPGGVVPKSQGDREIFLGPTSRFKSVFDPLDREYYESDERLIALALAYARAHSTEFRLEGF